MKTNRFLLATGFVLAMALTFSCSSDDGGTDSIGTIESIDKYIAKPASEIGNDKIKYSYSYGKYDFYYIYLGKLKNIPLFYHTTQHHNGINSTYTIEITETIKNSSMETITNSIQTAITVIDEHTESKTTDIKASQAINVKFPIKVVSFDIKAGADQNWNWYSSNSKTIITEEYTSLTNTQTNATEYIKTTMESRTWNFTNNEPAGYYRYTLFSTSDVYLYVIKNTETGEIDYEFREYVIPDTYFWQLDYSEISSFDKSDATGFEFDVSMLENLPKTKYSLTQSEKREIREEFSTAGTHTYTFDKYFPATVEVYALGAGGGGQGGNRNIPGNPFDNTWKGTGAAGGGGSAAYMKLSIEQPETFDITVGRGGSGGSGVSISWCIGCYWQSGDPGNAGGSSSVKISSTTITAEGGRGGGGAGTVLTGGAGGSAGNRPTGLLDWFAASGNSGNNGNEKQDLRGTNRGGSAAVIVGKGYEVSFGGGLGGTSTVATQTGGGGIGGYDSSQSGSVGGNGKVLIVITYEEIL